VEDAPAHPQCDSRLRVRLRASSTQSGQGQISESGDLKEGDVPGPVTRAGSGFSGSFVSGFKPGSSWVLRCEGDMREQNVHLSASYYQGGGRFPHLGLVCLSIHVDHRRRSGSWLGPRSGRAPCLNKATARRQLLLTLLHAGINFAVPPRPCHDGASFTRAPRSLARLTRVLHGALVGDLQLMLRLLGEARRVRDGLSLTRLLWWGPQVLTYL
jgi:hypothetical protein